MGDRGRSSSSPDPKRGVSEGDPPAGTTRFIADAMLGSLARKLRIFGFDTSYFRSGPDSELLEIARAEDRILLTSDRRLWEDATVRSGLRAFLVLGADDRARLISLVRDVRAASLRLERGDSRCAVCNGALAVVSSKDVEGELPASVARRHRLYHRCASCARIYWRGGHWSRLRRLGSLLDGGRDP